MNVKSYNIMCNQQYNNVRKWLGAVHRVETMPCFLGHFCLYLCMCSCIRPIWFGPNSPLNVHLLAEIYAIQGWPDKTKLIKYVLACSWCGTRPAGQNEADQMLPMQLFLRQGLFGFLWQQNLPAHSMQGKHINVSQDYTREWVAHLYLMVCLYAMKNSINGT